MTAAHLLWQRARWLRAEPGRIRLIALAVAPLALALPLDRATRSGLWESGALTASYLFVIILAGAIGRDSGRAGPWLVWVFQKGGSAADHLAARWCMDLAFALGYIALWCAVWALSARLGAATGGGSALLPIAASMLLMFLWAHALLFLAAAAGSDRGTDLLFTLAFLSLLQPLLLRRVPAPVDRLLHAALPPILDAFRFVNHVLSGDAAAALAAATHVLAWALACFAAAIAILRRWRPGA